MTDVEYYLSQVDWLNKKIENRMSDIIQLRNLAYGVSSTNSNTERVQTSTDKDQLSRAVSKIVDKERETNAMIDRMFEARERIIKQIEGLEKPLHYHVLYGKYFAKKGVVQLSSEIGYSRKQTYRIIEDAEKDFWDKYSAEILAYRYANKRKLSQTDTE